MPYTRDYDDSAAEGEIDLGNSHYLRFMEWVPDDLAANREQYGVPLPVLPKAAAVIRHKLGDGWCEGSLNLAHPEEPRWNPDPQRAWTVENWDPLTLNPSIRCDCGDHGHVQQGRWVPA